MPTFFDLLKYAKTGIASPGMTAYDKMRALSMAGGGAIKTLTGVPPLSFRANGKPLISWSMLGNGQQNGTPTPDNPIQPQFVGVRTENLWNEDYTEISGGLKYKPVFVGDGTFTMSTSCPVVESTAPLFLLAGNVQYGASSASNGVYKNRPITVTSISGYVTIAYRYVSYQSGMADPRNEQTMLNSGSTALPYEPYGYKLPITNAGQTVPIYLGEVPTVRRIRKLVLTGDVSEQWEYVPLGTLPRFRCAINTLAQITQCLCSHYKYEFENADGNIFVNSTLNTITACDSNYTSLEQWKSYLADEYAAGHPVTIWYVLSTPETRIVNEPLAKIGVYADELHSTDAGVSIPTVKGSNTLTVETDLQPSSISITGHIKQA